jgi:hypothetical protein
MTSRSLIRFTRLPWQTGVCLTVGVCAQIAIYYGATTGIDLASLDRSTFITALSAVATLVALFCSLSVAWILFVSQQAKAERVNAYDIMKSRILEAQRWLLGEPTSEGRDICLTLLFEIDKMDMSDLPQRNLGQAYPAYMAYCEALDEGLNSEIQEVREFWLVSSTHFVYIESLLSRIGLVSIRQVIAGTFIETLAKGVCLVAASAFVLMTAMLWYGEASKPVLVLSTIFVATGAALLMLEVWVDLRRYYDDDLDFIERGDDTDDAGDAEGS